MTPRYGDTSILTDYRNDQLDNLRQGGLGDQFIAMGEDMA
jgi:hypothetical protein